MLDIVGARKRALRDGPMAELLCTFGDSLQMYKRTLRLLGFDNNMCKKRGFK